MEAIAQQFFNLDTMQRVWPLLLRGLGTTAYLCALVIPLGLAGGLGWFAWRWYTTPVPPEIPLEKVEPAMVKVIETARSQVLKQPGSAKAWGDLGIVLQVHDFFRSPRNASR